MAGKRFGFLSVLVTLMFVGVVSWIAYGWGVAAGAATTAGGGTVVVAPGFGFPIFGILFGFLVLALVFGGIGRAMRGSHHGSANASWAGHGDWPGKAEWDGRSVPPVVEPMLQDWHRRAHAESGPDGTAGVDTER